MTPEGPPLARPPSAAWWPARAARWVRAQKPSLACKALWPLWRLDSKSELVYVGDAGTTDANRPSQRSGIEWNNRWRPRPWLLVDADLAWTRTRLSETAPEGQYIPGAVSRVGSVAISLRQLGPGRPACHGVTSAPVP